MIINFGDFTIQEAQVILAALKKLPMEVVEQLHNRMLATANEQFLAQQAKTEQPSPEVQADVNQAEANSDSMANE